MRMLREEVEVRAATAFGLLFALAAVCVAAHVDVTMGLIAYLGSCGLVSLGLSLGYAELVALSAWGFLTGFVVNRGGELTFRPADLEHLAALLALAAAVVVLRTRSGHGSRV
jgi:hypothetical protein